MKPNYCLFFLISLSLSCVSFSQKNENLNRGICPLSGDIIITEIMQNPSASADTAGEWFEVYNTTSNDIDLLGWTIFDLGTDSHEITISTVVPRFGYAILGRNNDTGVNGGLIYDYVYGDDIQLSNGDDEIILSCTTTMIDSVYYDGGPSFPDPNGASMELSINAMTSIYNDNGLNWTAATLAFGFGDLGTPGAINSNNTLSTTSYDLSEISVYPNPTSTGFVNISSKTNEAIQVSVFDILGKQVLSNTVNNNRLNVSTLTTGVYIMKIEQNGNSITKKLVVR